LWECKFILKSHTCYFLQQNFRERGHYSNRNRRDSYRSRDEEEPEWFTEGPTSQQDRIELHGFERRSNTPEREEENWRQLNKRGATPQEITKEVRPSKVEEETSFREESGELMRKSGWRIHLYICILMRKQKTFFEGKGFRYVFYI
jgi:hypothetical protein